MHLFVQKWKWNLLCKIKMKWRIFWLELKYYKINHGLIEYLIDNYKCIIRDVISTLLLRISNNLYSNSIVLLLLLPPSTAQNCCIYPPLHSFISLSPLPFFTTIFYMIVWIYKPEYELCTVQLWLSLMLL